MAALLGIVGSREAGSLLRQAAHVVHRRPWHRVEVVSDPGDRVALGFAGTRGGIAEDAATGVLAAVEGELYRDTGPVDGTEAARSLLAAYLAHGSGMEPEDGVFAAALWDPRRQALVLVTDRLGRRPLYVADQGGIVLVAGELKALVAAGLEPRLDLGAWSQFLAYEHFLGEHVPLEGVRLVPPGSTLELRREGGDELRRRWRYRLEPQERADEGRFVDEFDVALRTAVRRRLGSGTGLALSGGLDSRCLAAILSREAPGTAALTYGVAGSIDLDLGTRVAALAGLRHRPAPMRDGFLARGAAETVWLSEGHVRCFHVHHLALRALREADGLDSLLIGFGGDHVVRSISGPLSIGGDRVQPENLHSYRAANLSDGLVEQVLTPRFAAELRGRAREALEAHLGEQEGTPLARARQLFFETQRRKIWPGAELFADDLTPRDPYDDLEVIELCRRMPESLRQGGTVQLAYLRRFPGLASLPSTKQGMPPAVVGRSRRAREFEHKLASRARTAAGRLGAGGRPRRPAMADYATDLRGHGAALLGILTEPRTLDRAQLRAEAVRTLVEQTLSGRAVHTRALGVLLTFELFQRQFVDGDGFGAGTTSGRAVARPAGEPRTMTIATSG